MGFMAGLWFESERWTGQEKNDLKNTEGESSALSLFDPYHTALIVEKREGGILHVFPANLKP